jgi:hypothetical protein
LPGIFGGKITREPIGVCVDAKTRLQAGKVVARGTKAFDRAAELMWVGTVLGVIDNRELPARELQRDVEGLRFCAWPGERRRDDYEGNAMLACGDCRTRFRLILFDDDDDIQFCRRVVEPFNCRKQLIDDFRFTAKWKNNAVDDTTRSRQLEDETPPAALQ